MPHPSADQMAMIFKALLPPTGVLGAYCADVDDEVDEFGLYRHGLPRSVVELRTSELYLASCYPLYRSAGSKTEPANFYKNISRAHLMSLDIFKLL